ncbi:MAG TPA: plasmid recombination enzyme [Ruminococcaceae bacterium]|nr:plasmid recombination enzyme [Oscillospiraceae bacterium]
MPYGILRFAKMKGGPAKSLEAHHERKKEKYASNPDIDISRSNQNYHIIAPQKSYYYEIQSRIEKAQCKVRKDSIKFVDTIVTASPEFFKSRPPEEVKDYFRRAVDFLAAEVGRRNIFSAVVHMDERTPHMHLCFVPLTPDNRLSAKEIIGNRVKLTAWQDKFHGYMSQQYPELERGEPAVETKRKHIPVRLFKQATTLTAQMEQIKETMNDMSAFNLSRKRETVMKQLAEWIPKVGSFEKWIKQVEKGNQDLKDSIAALKDEKQNLEKRVVYQQKKTENAVRDYNNLAGDYSDMMEFINSIPKDLYEDLVKRYQELQEVTQDLDWDLSL